MIMEKFSEKRNMGVPATILCVLAYLIGYTLTFSLTGGLLVAVVFAALVFGLQCDDRVKNAVKQSYIVAALVQLVNLFLSLLEDLVELITPQEFNVQSVYSSKLSDLKDYHDLNAFQNALNYILKYGKDLIEFAIVVVFILFILQALRNKEFKLGFISKLLGEAPVGAQMYQQPRPNYQQPVQNAVPGAVCPNCGKVNAPGASFCAGCGSKIN
jgi:hypothetical protein